MTLTTTLRGDGEPSEVVVMCAVSFFLIFFPDY